MGNPATSFLIPEKRVIIPLANLLNDTKKLGLAEVSQSGDDAGNQHP